MIIRCYFFLFLNFILLPPLFAQDDKAFYQTIWGEEKIHLNLSVPFINYIYCVPPDTPYEQTGILGFSIGASKCNSDTRYRSFSLGVTSATPPGERFPDTSGWEFADAAVSFFINARQNYVWKRIDVGYGPLLSFHSFRYGRFNDKLNIDNTIKHDNWGLGASLSGYLRVVYFLYAGVLYQPQFFSITSGTFKYEHLLSFDILFRLDMKQKHP